MKGAGIRRGCRCATVEYWQEPSPGRLMSVVILEPAERQVRYDGMAHIIGLIGTMIQWSARSLFDFQERALHDVFR